MMNRNDLLRELKSNLDQIQTQINFINLDLISNGRDGELGTHEMNIYQIKNANGDYVLAPLLVAKAQLLSAIAFLTE